MTIRFIADRGDSRRRLDQVLVRRVTQVSRMSRTQAQSWIADGLVMVGGIVTPRPSVRVHEGAAIAVTLPRSVVLREIPRAEELPLDVLYEDDHLLVVNKPAGVVVHPSFRNSTGTTLNAVLWHLRQRPGVRPGLVSRLDKDTSGALLVALSPGAHARIQRDARAGRVTKRYVAIVHTTPQPAQGVIDLPLAHDPEDRRKIIVSEQGLQSETRYRVLSSRNGYSQVECELATGRTHQIRVHLSACGWPIAGDRLYGVPDSRIRRQALHSWQVTLPHPVSGAPVHFEAPIPTDMASLIGDAHAS